MQDRIVGVKLARGQALQEIRRIASRVLNARAQFKADTPAFVAQAGRNGFVPIDALIGAADIFKSDFEVLKGH